MSNIVNLDLFPLGLYASIVSEWLTIKDVRLLDVAHNCHSHRRMFLKAVSQNLFTSLDYHPQNFNVSSFCEWVVSRQIILREDINLGVSIPFKQFLTCKYFAEQLLEQSDSTRICLACWVLLQRCGYGVDQMEVNVTTAKTLLKLAQKTSVSLNLQRMSTRVGNGITFVICTVLYHVCS